MLRIDAINLILRACAQAQVNAITDENASIADGALTRERRQVLSNGYHFNTNTITLPVDTNGRVPLDRSFLKVLMDGNLSWRDDSTTGEATSNRRYVWNLDTNDWHDSEVSDVEVIFDIENLSLIPEQFARWIADRAALEHWYDTNQHGENIRLAMNVRHSSAVAINSLPPGTLNVYPALRLTRGGTAVRVGSSWVQLGGS